MQSCHSFAVSLQFLTSIALSEQPALGNSDKVSVHLLLLGSCLRVFQLRTVAGRFGGEEYQTFVLEDVAATMAAIWLAGMRPPQSGLKGTNGHHRGGLHSGDRKSVV